MIIEHFVVKRRQVLPAGASFLITKRLAPWLMLLAIAAVQAAPGGPVDPTDNDHDGAPDEVEANMGLDTTTKDNDVFGNARLFVMQQYRDFLSREADAAGTDHWVSVLLPKAGAGQAPVPRVQLVQTFLESAEFDGVVAPVARLYFAYFLRIPDSGGLSHWIGRHRGGDSLLSISDQFATSAEFAATYGSLTNAQFVQRVYSNVLARDPDADGLAYWIGQMAGGMTRGQVMVQFSESAEYRALIKNEVNVTMLYSGMLRRAPDEGGFNSWVNALESGTSVQELINLFLISGEYHARFLPDTFPAGAPVVKHTWPPHLASNVSVSIPVTVMFSKAMDPATVTSATVSLTGPSGPVAAQLSYSGNTATIVPDSRLMTGSLYSVTVTTGARDPGGTALASGYSFTFLTQGSEPPPVVAGCPTPDVDAKMKDLLWGTTPIHRQRSGAVTAIPIPQSPTGRASVSFTQGQGTSTPPNPTIELTVSRCPGVIEENLHPACRLKTTFPNFASITAFNRGLPSPFDTQEGLAGLGCLAPSATEPHYVNVRWTFPSCPYGEENCGFSLQWGEGAY